MINPGNPVGAVLDREDVAAWLGLGVVGMGKTNVATQPDDFMDALLSGFKEIS